MSTTFQFNLSPCSMDATVNPHQVDYRQRTGFGDRIIRVLLQPPEPRLLAWTEKLTPTGIETTPMSMSLSEVQAFVIDARHRAGA